MKGRGPPSPGPCRGWGAESSPTGQGPATRDARPLDSLPPLLHPQKGGSSAGQQAGRCRGEMPPPSPFREGSISHGRNCRRHGQNPLLGKPPCGITRSSSLHGGTLPDPCQAHDPWTTPTLANGGLIPEIWCRGWQGGGVAAAALGGGVGGVPRELDRVREPAHQAPLQVARGGRHGTSPAHPSQPATP